MRFRLIGLGFLVLILLPTADSIFGFSKEIKSTENRQLAQLPITTIADIKSVAREFKTYYKENFGGRNFLFYAYSRWKYYGLGESPLPQKVVLGKNGWFYLGNEWANVVDQHRGLVPMPTDSIRAIADHLTQCQAELARQGIKFYVLIAPDAQTIYPENLPDWALPYTHPSRLDQFLRYVHQYTTVPVIDVRDTLIASKARHPVYFQANSHWNTYGVLVACAALMNRLGVDSPTLKRLQPADYPVKETPSTGGDLVALCMLQNSTTEYQNCDVGIPRHLSGQRCDTIAASKTVYQAFRFAGPESRQPGLLFVGDSFSDWIPQYLPAYFSRSYFAHSRYLDPALVRAERPDVVVVEIVERNLDWLRHL